MDKVQITTEFGGDAVEIFKFTDVVCRHPAVLSTDGVAVHTALVITTEQTIHIELDKVGGLLFCSQQRTHHVLLPSGNPGVQCIFHELQRLLLNIRKA